MARQDAVLVTPVAPRVHYRPMPVTRPRGRLAFLLPLPVAAAAGLGAGAAPGTTLVVAASVVSVVVLVRRVEWAALAVVCAAVFEGYLASVSPWTTDWLVAVLLVAWAVRRSQGPLHHHALLTVVGPTVALATVLAVSYLAHPHGRAGLEVCATYAELALVMLVLADVMCGPLSPRRAARWYVLACVAASACGIVTALVDDRHRVVGPVTNADTFAFSLVAAVPLVGTVRTSRDQPVWWVWACFATLMVAVVGTQSRPAFVGLVAMVLVGVLTGQLALRYAGALIAVVTTGVALVIAVLPMPVGQALTDPQRLSDTNITQRNDFRLAAVEMTRAGPVIGLGPAAFPLLHQDYREVAPEEGDLDTAYSTALEASAELGLLGLAALYAVWIVPAVAARRRWLRDRSTIVAGALLALDGLLVASLLQSEQRVLPLWFVAAMVLALGRPQPVRTPIFATASDERPSGQVGPESRIVRH
ncbi:MAG TPA: O-antigen ligase family protein [Nocardioides sp.]|nr:O-antigen ligase family protein [Nocardioides sp.]